MLFRDHTSHPVQMNFLVFYHLMSPNCRISRSKVEVMLGINEEKLEVYPKDGYEGSSAKAGITTARSALCTVRSVSATTIFCQRQFMTLCTRQPQAQA